MASANTNTTANTVNTTVKSAFNFVKIAVAYMKGDDVEVKALKIKAKAMGVLRGQIAIKEANLFDLQEGLEVALENQSSVRVNHGEPFSKGEIYVQNLFSAQEAVEVAEEKLEVLKAQIEFLKEELAIISAE